MIQITKLSEILKQEVLNAITKSNFNCSDFEQNFEGDSFSSANCKKTFETENFNIEIEVTENVKWSSFRDYETQDIEVLKLKIVDENSDEFQDEFTDEEILNAINY